MVYTLDPGVSLTGGVFNGKGVTFPINDELDVWYNYGEGPTLPLSPLETPHQSIKSLAGDTPLPGYPVNKVCGQFSYQVYKKETKGDT